MSCVAYKYVKACAVLSFLIVIGLLGAVNIKEAVCTSEFNSVQRKAIAGDRREQFMLAQLYELGMFTQQSVEQAVIWYKQSAYNGYQPAIDTLNWYYKEKK